MSPTSFTYLMQAILDVMIIDPSRPKSLNEIATRISVGQHGEVKASQLIGPMNALRRNKWIRRIKTNVGEVQVGTSYYPKIERTYILVEGRSYLWKEIRNLLDYRGRIAPSDFAEAVQNVAEKRAEFTLAVARGDNVIPFEVAMKAVEMDNAETHKHPPEDDSWKEHKEKFFKLHTIMDREVRGNQPYMTRLIIGRLRFHIFHRGDLDADPHDHPWDFWTFPLRSYVEEVAVPVGGIVGGHRSGETTFELRTQVVKAWKWHFRPAEHRHRVLGAYAGYVQLPSRERLPDGLFKSATPDEANEYCWRSVVPGIKPVVSYNRRICTIVWRGKMRRTWGFWKSRAGRWCWQKFDKYIWEGGKDQPCGD